MSINARTDQDLATVMQEGMKLDASEGAVAAWIYMTSHGVCANVILRVLTTEQRRHDDPPFPTASWDRLAYVLLPKRTYIRPRR